jgi:hypothetical protein
MSARHDILTALRAAPAVGDLTPEQLLARYRAEVLAEAGEFLTHWALRHPSHDAAAPAPDGTTGGAG